MSKEYRESNRKAWNQAMEWHKKAMNDAWDERFSDEHFIMQKDEELDALKGLDIKGKDIAHLSCNNGIELMSLKRMGAGRCVGFDIADNAIADGCDRAKRYGIPCDFVQSDVLEIASEYNGQFDLVYITVGALVWIPDLCGYFKKAYELLKPGGKIFIYEHHPIGEMFPYDDEEGDYNRVVRSYFNKELFSSNTGIDYYGGVSYDSATSYEFSYTISDLFNHLIKCGFRIERFNEYNRDIALGHKKLEEMKSGVPLSYILIAGK